VPAPGIVLVILIVVAIAVIARYLIVIGLTLRQVSFCLQTVIGFVGQIPERTAPIEPVVGSINKDLGIARGVLEGLLLKKLGPATSSSTRRRYERAAAAAEPAGTASAPVQRLQVRGHEMWTAEAAETQTFFGPADFVKLRRTPPSSRPAPDPPPADPFLETPDDLFAGLPPAPPDPHDDGPPRLRPRRRGE
jgi:hypothetical protein